MAWRKVRYAAYTFALGSLLVLLVVSLWRLTGAVWLVAFAVVVGLTVLVHVRTGAAPPPRPDRTR